MSCINIIAIQIKIECPKFGKGVKKFKSGHNVYIWAGHVFEPRFFVKILHYKMNLIQFQPVIAV